MQVKNKSIIINNGYAVYNYKKVNQFVSLKNFNYAFDKNKIYCIIGESGSGKSTLISLFNGLNKLTYGDIDICGNVIQSKKDLNQLCLSVMLHNDKIIMKLARDANETDIKCFLLSIYDNNTPSFQKIKHHQLRELGINNKKNKFIQIDDNDIKKFTNFNIVKNITDFASLDLTRITRKGIKSNNKIKNYKELRRQIGMVSQFPEFQLFKPTVLDDVTFGPKVLGIPKEEAIEKAKEELTKLRIPETHYENSPFALSGGQKRRVAIAGILAINGNTLIFDEPTAGLDPVGEQEMLDIILNAKKEGKTVFVVTHSMAQVLEIADEALVIHDGRLISSGHPYDIFNSKSTLDNTNIEVPYVVRMVNKLCKKDKKFNELHNLKPRTIDELATYIAKIQKKGKGK